RCDQLRDGRALPELLTAGGSAAAVLIETLLCRLRVAVGLPVSAAGVVPAPVPDEAHHILQGVAQKDADLMGEFPLQAQPPGKLPQQLLTALIRPIPLPRQKGAGGWLREDRPKPSGPVQVDQTSTRLRTVFQDPDGDAVRGQLFGPAGR
ncbi:DUF1934 domain-containing protein, partial [Dysosmobacter welbionis]